MTDPQLPGITFYAKDKHGVEVQIALPVLDAAKIGAIADSLHDQGFTRSERLEPR